MSETEDHVPREADDSAGADTQLLAAVREYQAALEEGRRPSRREFLARHPEIAGELAECLDGLEFLRSAAGSLRSRPVTAPAAETEGILGDFQILREIGRGGMGVVYEAVQLSLGRRVALKVLPLAGTLDGRQMQRFENEARAAAQLHHGSIVPVFAVGRERGVPYYAMQLIDGQTLAAVIDDLREQGKEGGTGDTATTLGSLTGQSVASRSFFRRVAEIGVQVAEALEYAHQMGVVHRDIKPANLMLDVRGHLWVTDFGLARIQASPNLTTPGDLVGTLRYMSPEQAAGRPVIDPRSDVYSLGATLYELLTLQPLFPGTGRQEILRQILEEEPARPSRHNRSVPPELETILLKAVAREPADRYATARELADDLRRFLEDLPIQARRPSLLERAGKWARRHRSLVASLLVALVLSLAGLTAATVLTARAYERERKKAEEADLQRNLAEESFRQARRAVKLFEQIGEEELAGNPAFEGLRQRLLEAALGYYQDFLELRRDDPTIQAELEASRARVQTILGELATLMGAGQYLHLHHPEVQDELALDDEQRAALARIDQRWRAAFREFGQLDAAAREQRRLALAREQEVEVARLLSAGQRQRFRQIALQFLGPQAFVEPDVVRILGLSPEQKKRIRALRDQGMPGGPRFAPPGGRFLEDRKRAEEAILALLTPQQRSRWQELTGEPFRPSTWIAPFRFPGHNPRGPRPGKGRPPGDRPDKRSG